MISNALARALQRRNIHYGWLVAAATFLVMLATAGVVGAAAVLIEHSKPSSAGPIQRFHRRWRCGSSSTASSGHSRPR